MKCPECNHENPDGALECSNCYLRFRSPLVLKGDAGTIGFNVRQSVSRPTLKRLCADDYRFATFNPQFVLDTDGTDWFVEPGSSTFATHVNSTPLTIRTKLNDGDVLSIFVPSSSGAGEERAILTVSIVGG